jgi:hypothetical protein
MIGKPPEVVASRAVDLTPWSAGGPGPEHHAFRDHNRNDVLLGKGASNNAGALRKRSASVARYDLESGESDEEVDGVRCRRYQPIVGRRPDMIMAASSSAIASVSS